MRVSILLLSFIFLSFLHITKELASQENESRRRVECYQYHGRSTVVVLDDYIKDQELCVIAQGKKYFPEQISGNTAIINIPTEITPEMSYLYVKTKDAKEEKFPITIYQVNPADNVFTANYTQIDNTTVSVTIDTSIALDNLTLIATKNSTFEKGVLVKRYLSPDKNVKFPVTIKDSGEILLIAKVEERLYGIILEIAITPIEKPVKEKSLLERLNFYIEGSKVYFDDVIKSAECIGLGVDYSLSDNFLLGASIKQISGYYEKSIGGFPHKRDIDITSLRTRLKYETRSEILVFGAGLNVEGLFSSDLKHDNIGTGPSISLKYKISNNVSIFLNVDSIFINGFKARKQFDDDEINNFYEVSLGIDIRIK